jgi:hypothetical protein
LRVRKQLTPDRRHLCVFLVHNDQSKTPNRLRLLRCGSVEIFQTRGLNIATRWDIQIFALLKYFRVDIAKSYSSHRFSSIQLRTGLSANRETCRGFQQSHRAYSNAWDSFAFRRRRMPVRRERYDYCAEVFIMKVAPMTLVV